MHKALELFPTFELKHGAQITWNSRVSYEVVLHCLAAKVQVCSCFDLRFRMGAGIFRSYFDPDERYQIFQIECSLDKPPGAVGGRYGSGCFHFSSSFSVSWNNI